MRGIPGRGPSSHRHEVQVPELYSQHLMPPSAGVDWKRCEVVASRWDRPPARTPRAARQSIHLRHRGKGNITAVAHRRECLREDTLLAMIDGAIAPTELSAIEEHLGECDACL